MIYIVDKGDILNFDVEALVNPVNCMGIMGKGLALQFKRSYPENFKAYVDFCKKENLKPGKLFVYETMLFSNPKYIINFPTKIHWKDYSKLEYIVLGLKALRNVIIELDIKSIAVPALGCGLGGLDWESVLYSIKEELKNIPSSVFVFSPQKGIET
ncbi:MAG: hypothetical protein KatS3mg002_0419 [Candidatus Woesearchaeota archaeon]|nr:MAG: hypothetical protein KatS3mg002_0419 [Candidatus Woesearchaeota archaeon]